ncbi:MAG: DUF5618 family protein [Candidatus Ratteibacteria bacterium]
MKENKRYIENAKEILRKSKIEESYYKGEKYVKTAFGCLYLGILKAIGDFLLYKGIPKKKLPKKIDEYIKNLKRFVGPYNGKLINEFKILYDQVHIAGYYRGLLKSVKVVNEVFKESEKFIEKLYRLIK